MRWLMIVALLGAGYWYFFERDAIPDAAALAEPSPYGFQTAAMPAVADSGTVIVFAPPNCPSAAAQRARDLSAGLDRAGIPNRLESRFRLALRDPTPEERAAAERSTQILRGEIPAVFFDGVGAANPTLDEVVAEYRRIH